MNDVEMKIRDIIKKSLSDVDDIELEQLETLGKDVALSDFGFDSITYVKVTVDIESIFDIELSLDDLVMENYITIQSLCDMVNAHL